MRARLQATVRMSEGEKARFNACADLDGLTLSEWLRDAARRRAEELESNRRAEEHMAAFEWFERYLMGATLGAPPEDARPEQGRHERIDERAERRAARHVREDGRPR